MFKTKVKFKKSKKYGGARSNRKMLERAGVSLVRAIRERYTARLRDGDGKMAADLDDDYAMRKAASGKGSDRDGVFTGAMWRSLSVQISRGKVGDQIKLHFAGSSVVSEIKVQVSSIKTRKTRTKTIRTRVANKVKAGILQNNGKGRPITLLSMSKAELDVIAFWIRDNIDAFKNLK
jgi:hypothetical protein